MAKRLRLVLRLVPGALVALVFGSVACGDEAADDPDCNSNFESFPACRACCDANGPGYGASLSVDEDGEGSCHCHGMGLIPQCAETVALDDCADCCLDNGFYSAAFIEEIDACDCWNKQA